MDRTCLIAGCGYVGGRLALQLEPRRRTIALARSLDRLQPLGAAGVETIAADFDGDAFPADMPDLADGADVVYLAPPPETGADDTRLARFLAAMGAARPASLVYVSTTGVYGDAAGATVDEASPVAPTQDRSRRRVAAESRARDWCESRGVRHVVLRVPGIYGPHRLPLERLRRGEPALRHEDAGPGNRIHVDDLVAACVAAIERPVAGVFNVGDGNHASTTEFLEATAEIAGLPPPALVSLAEARSRISPGMLGFLLDSRRVATRRMREVLGVTPRYADIRAGIAASLAEMRAQGD